MSYQQNPAPYSRARHRPSLKRQQGVVIVLAMFIIALAVTMAYVMISRLERDTNRTGLLLHNAQAEAYARGSLAWAVDVLQSNAQNQRRREAAMDTMPVKSPENVVNGYKISSTIDDMQSRYNLNNLVDPNEHEFFMRLLSIIEPKLTLQQMQSITLAIQDWVKPDANNEELNKYYLGLPMPYRQAHRAMTNPSELQLVKGMTPQLYTALQPYITALPVKTPINVQTVPAQIIAALNADITLNIAQTILQLRQEKPFLVVQEFSGLAVITNKTFKTTVDVNSNYFLVETKVAIEQQKLVLYTLLERDSNEGKVKILWQSKGIW